MRALLERLAGTLHVLLALGSVWLLASSPWLHMYSRLPRAAAWADLAHVGVGVVVALLLPLYLLHCGQGPRWRLYFPWLAGSMGAVRRDLSGLLRGRLPAVEGGGLFAMLEGLLLLALLATGLTGLGWLAVQGSPVAMDWADVHTLCARVFAGLLLLHVLAVGSHLIDLVRD